MTVNLEAVLNYTWCHLEGHVFGISCWLFCFCGFVLIVWPSSFTGDFPDFRVRAALFVLALVFSGRTGSALTVCGEKTERMIDWGSVLLVVMSVVALRVIYFFLFVHGVHRKARLEETSRPQRLMVILGSGGHTTEALTLLSKMHPKKYDPLTFVLAESDSTSANRAALVQRLEEGEKKSTLIRIPRSREVRQSWMSSVWTTLRAVISAFPIVWKEKPDVILCNGPGTCIPICGVAWLLNVSLMGFLGFELR